MADLLRPMSAIAIDTAPNAMYTKQDRERSSEGRQHPDAEHHLVIGARYFE